MTTYHLGCSALADAFGVDPEAVAAWRASFPGGTAHAFPAPDVEIDGAPGWAPERLPELLNWRTRLPRRAGSTYPPASRGAYLEAATERGLFIDEAVRLLRGMAAELPELSEPEIAGWLVDRWR